ncbi:hypothetical protein HanRHA438_Chr05g0213791 [Helianthus annuus]|nr:hypothetical protein HanRHA438_Chr05g0213791 [Helianthus annuus]
MLVILLLYSKYIFFSFIFTATHNPNLYPLSLSPFSCLPVSQSPLISVSLPIHTTPPPPSIQIDSIPLQL